MGNKSSQSGVAHSHTHTHTHTHKHTHTVTGCFVPDPGSCGNNLLDDGEECDCGPSVNSNGLCRDDPCCNGTACMLANVECRCVSVCQAWF